MTFEFLNPTGPHTPPGGGGAGAGAQVAGSVRACVPLPLRIGKARLEDVAGSPSAASARLSSPSSRAMSCWTVLSCATVQLPARTAHRPPGRPSVCPAQWPCRTLRTVRTMIRRLTPGVRSAPGSSRSCGRTPRARRPRPAPPDRGAAGSSGCTPPSASREPVAPLRQGAVALSDDPVRCLHSGPDAADHGRDRVVQVLLWRRLRGRASTLLGSAHAFRLNATVPPAGPTEETMLKRVLAANSSWCREGPASSLKDFCGLG
jgi:hypothetical protein